MASDLRKLSGYWVKIQGTIKSKLDRLDEIYSEIGLRAKNIMRKIGFIDLHGP